MKWIGRAVLALVVFTLCQAYQQRSKWGVMLPTWCTFVQAMPLTLGVRWVLCMPRNVAGSSSSIAA